MRPSALQRGFVHLWLFFIGWVLQVFAAVAEDRMHIGGVYSTVFLQSAGFLSLLVSLVELFALLGKQEYAQQLHDAHQARDMPDSHDEGTQADQGSPENGDDEPSETTPLRAGERDYGSADQPTFANTYRRSVEEEPPKPAPQVKESRPYTGEQGWSGHLPVWTWFFQLLILVPVPLMLIGNLALVLMSSTNMTGTDGGSLVAPLLNLGMLSILILLPVTPFIHRVTHHVPMVLLLVFVVSFIYNLAAFPFSTNHRMKFNFQQIINLDDQTNRVTLSGIEEYVRQVIDSIPAAAGQDITCEPTFGRDLMDCSYDATSSPPDLVPGKPVEELVTVKTSRSADGLTAFVNVEAADTRSCYLNFNQAIYGFSVDGALPRETSFGPMPIDGITEIQLWRRDRERGWNVTVQLNDDGKSTKSVPLLGVADDSVGDQELKARSSASSLDVKVRCAWSDANRPNIIPAFHELRQYMPTWAVVTKKNVGLVEVWKTCKV